jgi:hypothetical protein
MHWRRVAGLGVLGIALAIPAAVFGLPLAARVLVRAVVLVLNGCVWLAMSVSTGASAWTVLGIIARSTARALAAPAASAILVLLLALGALGLYGLQQLLESEKEEERSE